MSKFCIRIINYFFYSIVALVLFSNIIRIGINWGGGIIGLALSGVFLIMTLVLLYFGETIINKIKKYITLLNKISVLQMIIFMFVFVAGTKILLVFLLDTELTNRGDMGNYVDFAYQIAKNGNISSNTFYASMYDYTAAFGWFLAPVVKLFGYDVKVILVFMSVLYATISVLLFDIIRPSAGKNNSFIWILLFNILPAGLFISQVVVHETALLFFYVVSYWLFLKALDVRYSLVLRAFAMILSAFLISLGSCINEGGKVVVISYIIIMFIKLFKDKITLKRIIKFFISSFCIVISLLTISNMCMSLVSDRIVFSSQAEKQYTERIIQSRLPLGWIFYTGSNQETRGEFSEPDFDTYNQYYNITDINEARNYQRELIDERIKIYKDNPLQIPVQLYYKFKKMYARPFVGLEYFIDTNYFGDMLHNNSNGLQSKTFKSIGIIYNIFVMTIILFSYKRHRKNAIENYYNSGLQMKLFIIGITLALILFEVTNKYVCHTQIIFSCICALSVSNFYENSKKFRLLTKAKLFKS